MRLVRSFGRGFAALTLLALAGSVIYGISQAETEESGQVAIGPVIIVDTHHDDRTDELTLGPGVLVIGAIGGGINAAAGLYARGRAHSEGSPGARPKI